MPCASAFSRDDLLRLRTAAQAVRTGEYQQVTWLEGQHIPVEARERRRRRIAAAGKVQRIEVQVMQPAEFEISRIVGIVAAAVTDAVAEHRHLPMILGHRADGLHRRPESQRLLRTV